MTTIRAQYSIPGYGIVPNNHHVWLYCVERCLLPRMEVGDTMKVSFERNRWTDAVTVTRMQDADTDA